jgi:hypothetical protein
MDNIERSIPPQVTKQMEENRHVAEGHGSSNSHTSASKLGPFSAQPLKSALK